MSINLRHVTSENTVILVCTTFGNNQRERGVETATGNKDNVSEPSFDIKCMEEDGPATRKLHAIEKF